MTVLQTVRTAFRALLRNKLRSFLTTLGVVIGVAAVIAMVSIGQGAKQRVEETFASMGTNILIVTSGSMRSGGMMGGAGSLPTLTWEDLEAIRRDLPSVRWASPMLRGSVQVIAEEQNWGTSCFGVTPEYFDIRNWRMESGERFSESDVDGAVKVAVLGQTVVEKLFGPGANPVGQVVRIKNMPFEIVAVMERKGQSPMGQDFDDAVFIPVSTFRSKIQGGMGTYIGGNIFVGAHSAAGTTRAESEIKSLLRDRHRILGPDDDFSTRNLTEFANMQAQGTKIMTNLLAAVAIVSLFVGGIGIMNIMLVSVTERTREIGIRMAVGAKPHQVLLQFLVESVALSMLGGLVGVALGAGVARLLASKVGWPYVWNVQAIGIAFGFSAVIGIAFGIWPAFKASRLDPIEALRFE